MWIQRPAIILDGDHQVARRPSGVVLTAAGHWQQEQSRQRQGPREAIAPA
jgi:hypothetical protein